jgi:hypothetical protein
MPVADGGSGGENETERTLCHVERQRNISRVWYAGAVRSFADAQDDKGSGTLAAIDEGEMTKGVACWRQTMKAG